MTPRYWFVGNRECKHDRWLVMYDGGFISIGWAEIGDPRLVIRAVAPEAAKGALADAIKRKYPGKTPGDATRGAGQVLKFVQEMRRGDRVVMVEKGQILGVGVIRGNYEYVRGDIQPNHRSVLWMPNLAPYPDKLPHRLPPVFMLDRPSDKSLVDYMESVAQAGRPEVGPMLDGQIVEQTRLADEQGAFDPADIQDARQRVAASIVRRRGQPAFRAALLDAYGGQCAITGCAVEGVLEAAHIIPYQGEQTNDVRNGLLLRADIHTLFDLGLIAVAKKGNGLKVVISDRLAESEYAGLEGSDVRIPTDPKRQPSAEALVQHRREAGL